MASNAISSISVEIAADASRFAERARTQLRQAGPALESEGGKLGGAIAAGMAAGIAAGAAGVAASMAGISAQIRSMVQSGVEASKEIANLSKSAGVSSEGILKLREAVSLTGGDFDLLKDILNETRLALGEALGGDKAKLDGFKALNLDVQAFAALQPDKQVYALANALNGVGNSALATARASIILGEDVAVNVLPSLLGASRAAGQLGQQWQSMGAVLSSATIEAAAGIGAQAAQLGMLYERTQIALAAQLAPTLATITAGIFEWVAASGGVAEISSQIADIAYAIYTVVTEVAGAFFGASDGATNFLEIIKDGVFFVGNLGKIAAGFFRVFKTGAAIVGTAMAMAMEAPTIAFTYLANEVVESLKGILRFVGGAISSIRGMMEYVANAIQTGFGKVINFLIDGLNKVLGAVSEVMDFLGLGRISSVANITFQPIEIGQTGAESAIKEIEKSLGTASEILTKGLSDGLENAMNAWKSGSSEISAEWDAAMKAFKDATDGNETVRPKTSLPTGSTSKGWTPQDALNDYIQRGQRQAASNAAIFSTGAMSVPSISSVQSMTAPQAAFAPTFNIPIQSGVTRQELGKTLEDFKREVPGIVSEAYNSGGTFRQTLNC